MKLFTGLEIANILKGKVYRGNSDLVIKSVHQDSRLVSAESLFFAIRGDAFDGHNFIDSAVQRGANVIVVEDIESIKDSQTGETCIIIVEDTVKALQNLAKYYISLLNTKKIAITGSTGKTTTRDMIYHVCSEKYKTKKNQGNFNSVVGVPLTIMELSEETEVAVIEMGMDTAGEIDLMAEIVRPEIGVITNIGLSHIQNFKDKDGIFRAKMEITNYFDRDSKLIVTEDEEFLNESKISSIKDREYQLILTGESENDGYRISQIEERGDEGVSFKLRYRDEEQVFDVPLPGRHNAFNGALAVAVGREIGVSFKEAARGIKKLEITGKRLSISQRDGIKVIDDTYNASPDSMRAALNILSKTEGGRKIAVLGDMYELGEREIDYHKEIGVFAKEKADIIITIGNLGGYISDENHFETKDELVQKLKSLIKAGDVILFKGSRGMHLEEIIDKI